MGVVVKIPCENTKFTMGNKQSKVSVTDDPEEMEVANDELAPLKALMVEFVKVHSEADDLECCPAVSSIQEQMVEEVKSILNERGVDTARLVDAWEAAAEDLLNLDENLNV